MARVRFARSTFVSPTANPVGPQAWRFISMYVPTTFAQPAGGLAPVGIVSIAPPIDSAVDTAMSIRRAELNVLDGHEATVTGTLRPGLAGRVVMLQAMASH